MMQEHTLQSAAIDYLNYTVFRDCYFSIPNGAKRTPACAAWMKKEGLRSGIPDLFIAKPKRGFHGLFIEFKSARGRVSDSQEKWHKVLEDNDYMIVVIRTIDDFIRTIEEYAKND